MLPAGPAPAGPPRRATCRDRRNSPSSERSRPEGCGGRGGTAGSDAAAVAWTPAWGGGGGGLQRAVPIENASSWMTYKLGSGNCVFNKYPVL